MSNQTPEYLEHEVMVHRYLYYVEAQPIISDFEYGVIERQSREVLPKNVCKFFVP